jgi:hypothetical protein
LVQWRELRQRPELRQRNVVDELGAGPVAAVHNAVRHDIGRDSVECFLQRRE